jgi:DNA-binding transcriptional LysR family regulator
METLDLNLIKVFIAIYESRSVTLAAERFEVTQPTISYALSKLRTAYGDRLFIRHSKGLAPTPIAENLYRTFCDATKLIEATLEQRHLFDPLNSTHQFRLAMSDIGVLYFAPPLLTRFQSCAPRLEIEIVQTSDAISEGLRSGRTDVAIGNLPFLIGNTQSAHLFREHYVCLLSSDHPDIADEMTLSAFSNARHLMVVSPSSGHRLVDEILSQQGVVRRVVARVPQFTVLPRLIPNSDLLVILPSRVAALFVAQGGLKALPLPIEIPSFDVRVHWHIRQENGAAHKWLIREIVETLGAL